MAPRLSILPGRFCEDARADIYHHRVIQALGRHTDNDGWCRVRQQVIADAISASRATVNRKLADLVHWGYVAKHAADTSGRSIFYRVIYDSPAIPEPHSSENEPDEAPDFIDQFELVFGGPVTDGLQAVYNLDADNGGSCNPPVTPAVTPSSYTCCNCKAVTHNDPSQRSSSTTSPPLPPVAGPEGGGRGFAKGWTVEGRTAIERIASDPEAGPIIEHLLAPLVGLLNPPAHVDPVAYVDSLVAQLRGVAPEILAAVAETIGRDRKRDLPSLPDILAIAADHAARMGQAVRVVRAVSDWTAPERKIMAALKGPLGPDVLAAWFTEVWLAGFEDGKARFTTANAFVARWIDTHYRDALAAAAAAVLGPVASIEIKARG